MCAYYQQSKNKDKQYLPIYNSSNELLYIQNILKAQTSLVSIKSIRKLRHLIAEAALGGYFLIQSGEGVESFYDCDKETSFAKLDFIRQLSDFFQRKTGSKVIQVGRIAGLYAKPGSGFYERSRDKRIYSGFDPMANPFHRRNGVLQPWAMLLGYNCSASIYREINLWNRELEAAQKIYTSHEALVLNYEKALTRLDKKSGSYFNLSTHFPWVGTSSLNSTQHINYLKNIANPIAIKIGPDTSIKNLIRIIGVLDPEYLPGRITLIPRLGAQQVHDMLPQLIHAVKDTKRTVLWSCDPMHGNTETASSGVRIRKLSNIVEEIKSSFLIHREMGSQLNALHLEATHQNISEWMDYDSSLGNSVYDPNIKGKNRPDPRLNYVQTMHVMQQVAKHYMKH